jgi:ring-1,2-phenylacetyl-CoA epoxidase subunit PaaE
MPSFRIHKVHAETSEAIRYDLLPLEKFDYKAGQFLTFVLHIHGKEVRRSYSLSSTPGVDEYASITVKRIPNGEVSRYIQDYWKEGDIVDSLPALGRFVLEKSNGKPRDIFLIGAGSGITPLMGLMKDALYHEPECHVKLFYSNRNLPSAIFYNSINSLKEKFETRLEIEHFFGDSKYLERARLNKNLLEELVTKHLRFAKQQAVFYLCGPHYFMQMAEIVLKTMGFDKNNIRKEIFADSGEVLKKFELEDKTPKEVTIYLGKEMHKITVHYNESILDAALKNKIAMPYNCRAGKCSACFAKCTQGKVVMSYNEVLTQRDEAQGYVLTCTGHPLTNDVVIQL